MRYVSFRLSDRVEKKIKLNDFCDRQARLARFRGRTKKNVQTMKIGDTRKSKGNAQ